MAGTRKKRKREKRKKISSSTNGRSVPSASETYNVEYATILDKAQTLLDSGDNLSAEETVKPLLTEQIRSADSRAFLFASRIAAFAAAQREDLESARLYALEALRLDENLLDLHFLLTYIFARLEDYALVKKYGKQYLALHERIKETEQDDFILTGTGELAHEVLNNMGVAYREEGNFQEATGLFKQALDVKQDFEIAYINLSRLFEHDKQHQEARSLLDSGVKACPESQELRMLSHSAGSARPTVSACMIVKNEQEQLPRALDSIKDLCDEIIVVDTGSTDRTVEIAESYGARIYHHEWENDFSKARNQSLSYATRDWILIIDADEELVNEDIPLLEQVLQQTEHNLISITVYNMSSEDVLASSFLPSIRLFRRSLDAHYDGIVHNQLKFDEKNNIVLRAGVRIKHYGYGLSPDQMKKKVARSRGLLLKQLEEDPNNAFANFNLAQLYRGESPCPSKKICNVIIKHATRAIEHTDPNKKGERHLHLMALHQMVTAHFFKKELDEAEQYCFRALEHKKDFIDPIISLGHIYSQKADWPNARKWFMRYLDERAKFKHSDETLQIILLNYDSKHIAYYGLGVASEAEGKSDDAIDSYRKALAICADYADTHLRLARLYHDSQDYDNAIIESNCELEQNSNAWPAHYILGESYMRIGKAASAETHLIEADRLESGNREIMSALARLYFTTERFDEAGKIADQLESRFPDYVPIAKLIGDIRYETGDFAKTIRAYERFIYSGQVDEDIWNNMGNSYFKLEQYDEAERCYRNALAARPDMALAMRNLGISLARAGKTNEAVDKLASFLELAPDDFPVAHLLGDIMFEKGQLARAMKLFELCVSLEPTSYQVITKLADVYYIQGHYQSARLGYAQALKLDADYEPAKSKLEALEATAEAHT
jgi:tetratricopeptide (TPR) repeat protein